MTLPLSNLLRMSVVESRIARIKADAGEIESAIETVNELRKMNGGLSTPIADLRLSATALRQAAMRLDEIVRRADVL